MVRWSTGMVPVLMMANTKENAMIVTLCSVWVNLTPGSPVAGFERFDFNPPNAEREAKEFAAEVIYGYGTATRPSVIMKCWEESK